MTEKTPIEPDQIQAGDLIRAEWPEDEAPHAPAPWTVISTDRDQPTLARVTWTFTNHAEVRYMFREGEYLYDADADELLAAADTVKSVEVLHTHNPETHVPVERALIDEFREFLDSGDSVDRTPYEWRQFVSQFVAALADVAKS